MKNPITSKRIFFFVLILSLSFLMAACGSAEDEGTTDDVVAPDQGAVATEEVIEEPVTDTGSDVVQPEVQATDETMTEEDTQADVGQDQSTTTEEDQTQAETVEEPAVDTTESDMAETESMTETEVAQQDQTQQGEMIPPTGAINADELSTLLDFEVWNRNNEQIGDVDDMIIDMQSSQIEYVVVGVGGFLGIGEKSVAVPWSTLEMNQMQPTTADTSADDTAIEAGKEPLNVLFLDATQDRLEQAPEANLDFLNNEDVGADENADTPTFEEQEQEIDSFWGVESMSNGTMTDEAMSNATTTDETMTNEDKSNATMTDETMTDENTSDKTMTDETMTDTSKSADTTGTDVQMGEQQLVLASALIDADIVGTTFSQPIDKQQDDTMEEPAADQSAADDQDVMVDSQANANADVEEIGNVEEVVIDHTTGHVDYVLVSLDDVALNNQTADTTADTTDTTVDTADTTADTQADTAIAGEDELVPVPLSAFTWNADEEALSLTSVHPLKDAPTITFDKFLNDVERTWESAINDYWADDTSEQNNN